MVVQLRYPCTESPFYPCVISDLWCSSWWHIEHLLVPLSPTFHIHYLFDSPQHPHQGSFTDEEMKAQRDWVTCVWPQSWPVAKLQLSRGLPYSKPSASPLGLTALPFLLFSVFLFPYEKKPYTLCSGSLKFQGLSSENSFLHLLCLIVMTYCLCLSLSFSQFMAGCNGSAGGIGLSKHSWGLWIRISKPL